MTELMLPALGAEAAFRGGANLPPRLEVFRQFGEFLLVAGLRFFRPLEEVVCHGAEAQGVLRGVPVESAQA